MVGGATAEQRKLAPPAGCAVEPQHRLSRRVAELGEAETPTGGQVEAALGAWLLDAGNPEWVPPPVIYRGAGWFASSASASRSAASTWQSGDA